MILFGTTEGEAEFGQMELADMWFRARTLSYFLTSRIGEGDTILDKSFLVTTPAELARFLGGQGGDVNR